MFLVPSGLDKSMAAISALISSISKTSGNFLANFGASIKSAGLVVMISSISKNLKKAFVPEITLAWENAE